MKKILKSSLVMLPLLVMACSHDKKSAPELKPIELYNSDRSETYSHSYSGASLMDGDYNNLFSKTFGGASGSAVQSYLDARVSQVWDYEEFDSAIISPELKEVPFLTRKNATPHDGKGDSGEVEILAFNVSSNLWAAGKVNGVSYSMVSKNHNFVIDSPRHGLIGIGPAYSKNIKINGRSFETPFEYRRSFLIHEARHSDCTGGFSQDYVQKAKVAVNYEDFLLATKQTTMTCGHVHTICEYGELRGAEACDNEKFGAYGITLIYVLASAKNYPDNSRESRILEAWSDDVAARIDGIEIDDLKNANPDMSSSND